MRTLTTHARSILGLLGLSRSRRHGTSRTRRRPLPLNLERFEARVVPAVVSLVSVPLSSPIPVEPGTPASSLFDDNAAKFSTMNNEICVTFKLTDASNVPTGGVLVTLSSYTIAAAGSSTTQTLLTTQTAHLTTLNQTVTLCVEVDDELHLRPGRRVLPR